MVVNNRTQGLLIDLGMTEYEAKAYMALMRCQPATPYEIAKAAGLPTSKIYETIKRLTDQGGASRFFLGGVIAYDNEVKRELLDVSTSTLEQEGAVSRTVAEQMAGGIAARLGTDAGIGITGVAGPGGGTAESPLEPCGMRFT